MILGNVRAQLRRDDAQLAVRLLARGSATEQERAESELRDRGIDVLLDDPRLLPALMEARQAAHASLPLFMYVAVRSALRKAGETDRMLADYVASILVHFAAGARALQIAEVDDEQYDSLSALCRDLDAPDPRRGFLVRQHLGNYALWLAGLFPDRIEHMRWRRGGPQLDYYDEMGSRGFRLAADHPLAERQGVDALFAVVAERFVTLRIALNSLSDALLFPDLHTPERLMRQVRDATRWSLSS